MEVRWSRGGALLFVAVIAVSLTPAHQDAYSISQISPNSASDLDSEEIVVTETESDRTRAAMDVTPTLNAEAIFSSRIDENDDEHHHTIVVRSAAPILRSSEKSQTFDNIVSLNKLEDIVEANDVKVHQNQYYKQIQPTKTQQQASAHKFIVPSIVNEEESVEGSGEARGVPRGRALTPKGPRSAQTATTQTSATSLRYDTMGRQATPDIQDIITGLVKLLNGNVNVQANTQQANGRPLRPQNTRINNRGPPRISDVPPLPPDFDTPGPAGPTQLMPPLPPQPSTKIPPPYPFDRPPSHLEQTPVRPFLNGVPLPEQIVPITNQNYRPGFNNGIRPQNPPPWQRPRPRPPPTNRRPNPNLPMFKPQPPLSDSVQTHVDESFTTIPHVEEPVLQLKPGYVQEDINDQNLTESEETTTIQNVEENNNDPNETLNQNQISLPSESESFVPARDPPTVSTSTQETPKESTTENKVKLQGEPTKQEILKDMENGDKKKQTMIKNEKEKPSINNKKEEKIKDTEVGLNESTTMKNVNSNGMLLQPTPTLESSMVEITKDNTTQSSIQKSTSIILTDALPEIKVTKNATSQLSPNLVTPSSIINSQPSLPAQQSFPYHPYKPRPGIVLDDTEYRPVSGQSGGAGRRPKPPQRVPAPYGEIFDVTVSAIQGPNGGSGSATVQIENVNPISGNNGDIIVSASGDQGFVSIDGKRTYLNLFGDSAPTSVVKPTPVQKSTIAVTGSGFAVPEIENAPRPVRPQGPRIPINPSPPRRPQQPPVRIDTCIVGDDSTCDQTQNEKCKTEAGISSCQCRPGYAKRNHRDPCRKVVAMVFSLRVDRMYDRKIAWDEKLGDKESEVFQQLSYEAAKAVDSAFSMTPYSDEFVSGTVNTIYKGDPTKTGMGVYANVTILLEESGETLRSGAGADITKHLLGVIQRRSNNIGASALWVDRPAGSVSKLYDLDECSSPDLNDCHELAVCTNIWGSFKCECPSESKDTWIDQPNRAGRHCHTCPPSHCSNRGTCSYRGGQPACSCSGSYYGSQCEVDGEVVGVAVGASLAALVVILLTLACLVMWSRRWSREQKTAAGMGSPVFGYMTGGVKTPNMGQPPYQVTLEERMRWAQLADVMAQANHYAQPEPVPGHPGARPSSAMYGAYPTLSMAGTLPPVPMPRLGLHLGSSTLHLNNPSGNNNTIASRTNTITGIGQAFSGFSGFSANHGTESTSSESDGHAQDRTDLLGSRGFHVPRPKSRSNATNSIANQSGIYYDVDYENAPDPIYGTKGIPLSTYTMNRGQPFYRQ